MKLNFRYLLIFLISFMIAKVSFASIDTSKAVIFAHANIVNDSNAILYLRGQYSKKYDVDSVKSDINGNFKFVVTVKMANKGYYIGKKDSVTNKILWLAYIILNPNDTVRVDLAVKNINNVEFVPNKGNSHHRFFNGLETIKKEFDTIALRLNTDITYNTYSAYVNFTFPYIDSIIDIDPFVGLELAYIHHQSMFLNYRYSTDYIEGFYKKLNAIIVKDSSFNANPSIAWYNKQLRLNKIAPPFTLNNIEEQKITLDKYKKNYLLIDIWASWCVPCIEESKKLVKVYPKYKKHNLQILGITTDESKEAWKNAVKKHKFDWEHVWLGTDVKTKNEINANYRIFSIPITILLAPGGKVLKINPTLKEIEAEIIK